MDRFLRKVDAFDLQNYLHAVHYEDLKVPHVVWMRMKAKGYYGLEEMKNGELDFLKQTVLSKSMEPVFFAVICLCRIWRKMLHLPKSMFLVWQCC